MFLFKRENLWSPYLSRKKIFEISENICRGLKFISTFKMLFSCKREFVMHILQLWTTEKSVMKQQAVAKISV